MKKILILILAVWLNKEGYGQYPNAHTYSSQKTIETPRGAMNPLLGFIPPLADTLNNINVTYVGAYTTRPQDSKPYYSNGTKWIAFGSGGGSSGLTFPSVPHKYLTGYDDVFATLNTDSITEGATNLFFTNVRARRVVRVLSPVLYDTTTLATFGTLSVDTTTYLGTKTNLLTKWSISGNAGTTSANFIGTTDNVALRFKVNNRRYGFLDNDLSVGNMGFGDGVLAAITSGTFNTAFGYSALLSTTSGASNTAMGASSLLSNTTGTYNLAFGSNALTSNTTGINNTALGASALKVNTTASYSTAVGARALFNSTGQRNTAVGQASLEGVTTGESNTAIGENTRLFNNGNYNTFLGHSAGYNSTGDSSIFIGYQAGYSSTGNGKLYIANSNSSTPLIYGSSRSTAITSPYIAINAGATADTATAVFSVRSTTKGVLFPRMNTTQMNAISSPPAGLMLFNTDTASLVQYNGSIWQNLRGPGGGGGGGGSGTVTSVATGYGLSGGTITATVTLILDSATMFASAGGPVRKTDSVNAVTGYTSLYKNSLKQNRIVLKTVGTTGAASLVVDTLNIPNYGGGQGNVNTNLGAGFRLANDSIPKSNALKTLRNRYGLILDSAKNVVSSGTDSLSTINFTVDSSKITTTYRIQAQIHDTIAANQLVIDNVNGTDSFANFISSPDTLRFKLPVGTAPIKIVTTADNITWSIPTYVPGANILTVGDTMTLTNTSGSNGNHTYTFPSTDATVARTDATAQTFLGDITFSGINMAARMRSGTYDSVSNIIWKNAATISNQTDPNVSRPIGVPGISYRVNFVGANSIAVANYGYSNLNIGRVSFTTASSGEHPYGTNLMVQSPVVVDGGSRVSSLSNIEISGKPLYTYADTAVSLMVRGSAMITDTTKLVGGLKLNVGSDATGDVFYRNSSGMVQRLGIGTTGKTLVVFGGLPSWGIAERLLTTISRSSKTIGATAANLTSTTGTVITRVVVRVSAASAITVGPTVSIGTTPGGGEVYAGKAMVALLTVNDVDGFTLSGASKVITTGNNVYCGVTGIATGTSQTIEFDVFGYNY